jgi:hypothetical protein
VQRYLGEFEISGRLPRSVNVKGAYRKSFCISASSKWPMALTEDSKFLSNGEESWKPAWQNEVGATTPLAPLHLKIVARRRPEVRNGSESPPYGLQRRGAHWYAFVSNAVPAGDRKGAPQSRVPRFVLGER